MALKGGALGIASEEENTSAVFDALFVCTPVPPAPGKIFSMQPAIGMRGKAG